MTVQDLILRSDNLTLDAYKEKAFIFRFDKEGISRQIGIDLNLELSPDFKSKTKLMPGDILKIDFISKLFSDLTYLSQGMQKILDFLNIKAICLYLI